MQQRATSPPGEFEPARKRRRPAKSCEPCRNRKVGCDQALPCGPCERARKPIKCFYRAEDDESRLQSESVANETSSARGHSGNEDLESRIRRLESLVQKYESEREVNHSPKLLLRNTPEKTRAFGRSHWMYIAETLPSNVGAVDRRDAELDIRDPDVGSREVMSLCDKLRDARKAAKSGGAGQGRPLAEDLAASLPHETICSTILDHYFRTFQPIYRIVHRPSFMDEWSIYWRAPASNATPLHFRMKMVLMLAIGSTFYDDDKALEIRQRASHWIRLAQEWIAGPTEKTTLSLDGLQVFCLLLLAKQTTLHSPGSTWISAGSLLNVAMSMGLHRDPSVFPSLTPMETDMRKRLWAATVELTTQTVVDSAVPVLLSAEDFDTSAPLNVNDEDLTKNTKSMPSAKAGLTDASLQIQLFESIPLRLEVARRLNGLKELTFEDAWKLGARLRDARRRMAALFRDKAQESRVPMWAISIKFHQRFVDLLFHRHILLLHQPFMIRSRDNPGFHLSRKTCVESAEIMASYVADIESDMANLKTDELYMLATSGRGSFKGPYALHVILVLCLELLLQLQERGVGHETGDRLDEMHKTSRERLKSALENIAKHSSEFIAAGSVSMKSYFFLAAVLAHVDAVETGGEAKRAAYEALKKSLAECVHFLESRTDKTMRAEPAESECNDSVSDETQVPALNMDVMDAYMNWDISSLLNIPTWEGA